MGAIDSGTQAGVFLGTSSFWGQGTVQTEGQHVLGIG